jgi:TetR/AcrR family transcriptional regulator, lmrAB and yxaGH operons repressor
MVYFPLSRLDRAVQRIYGWGMSEISSREMLLRVAARLFRQKGYDGTGLNEILAASGLPKGSLYHHFPGGKRELAEAATRAGGEAVARLVERVFAEAVDFSGGAVALCHALAEMIAQQDGVLACPVVSILQVGTHEPYLRAVGREVLAGWQDGLARQARRLGHPAPDVAAEMLIMQLEGAWVLALAAQGGAPFLRLARWLALGAAGLGSAAPAPKRKIWSLQR